MGLIKKVALMIIMLGALACATVYIVATLNNEPNYEYELDDELEEESEDSDNKGEEVYERYLQALRTGNGSNLTAQEIKYGIERVNNLKTNTCTTKLKEVFPNGITTATRGLRNDPSRYSRVIDYTGKYTPLNKLSNDTHSAYLIDNGNNEIIVNGINYNYGFSNQTADDKVVINAEIYRDMFNYLVRKSNKSEYKVGLFEAWGGAAGDLKKFMALYNINVEIVKVSRQNWHLLDEEVRNAKINEFDIFLTEGFIGDQDIPMLNYIVDSNKPMLLQFILGAAHWNAHAPWLGSKLGIGMTGNAASGGSTTNVSTGVNIDETYESICKQGDDSMDSLIDLLVNNKFQVMAFVDETCVRPGGIPLPEKCAYRIDNGDQNPEHDWTKIFLRDGTGRNIKVAAHDAIMQLESLMKGYDDSNTDVFETNQHYVKGILLLGDHYRKNIVYYNSAKTMPDELKLSLWDRINGKIVLKDDVNNVFRALFADRAINYSRKTNHAQQNVGDFSPKQAEIIDMLTGNKSLTVDKLAISNGVGTSTGAYAKPGSTVKVHLLTETTSRVRVRISTVRNGSTRAEWYSRYQRPDIVAGNYIDVQYGKPAYISSPIGGPLYIVIDGDKEEYLDVKFENILQHPALLNPLDDKQVEKFVNDLQNTKFNWVDIKTLYAEIHSTTKNMIDGINNGLYNGDVRKYIDYFLKYTIFGNIEYAGYTGIGLKDLSDNVKNWAKENGIPETDLYDENIHRKRGMQHWNSDKPACGDLCSGNPVDQWSPVRPTSWGESHEIGHNLQSFNLYHVSGEVSNNIFSGNTDRRFQLDHADISETKGEYFQERGYYNDIFNFLNKEHLLGTEANENHPLWVSGSVPGTNLSTFDLRLGIFRQIEYAAQDVEFYTKAYLWERIANYYSGTDQRWTEEKAEILGLKGFTRLEVRQFFDGDIRKNKHGEKLAIVSSMVSGKNTSEFMRGLGIEVSTKVESAINAKGNTTMLPRGLYYIEQKSGFTAIFGHNEYGKGNLLTSVKMATKFVPFGTGAIYQ